MNDLQSKKNLMSYRDMSDDQFVRAMERLSLGYYDDYMKGRAEKNDMVDVHMYDVSTASCVANPPKKSRSVRGEVKTGVFGRNVFAVLMTLLLSLASLVALFLPYLPDFLFGWTKNSPTMTTVEIVKSLFGKGDFYALFDGEMTTIFGYITVGLIIAGVLFDLLLLVFSIVSLAKKKDENGIHKKFPLTFFAFMAFFCGAFAAAFFLSVCGMATVGYGCLWQVGLGLIATLFSLGAYKKKVKIVPVIRDREEFTVIR